MKKLLLILMIFTLLMIFSKKIIFAQDIKTGNASAKSSVTTNINGSGEVHTKIEVEANGEKKELDASSSGSYKLEINSSKENFNAPTASISPVLKKTFPKIKQKQIFIFEIRNILKDFLQSLKTLFKI